MSSRAERSSESEPADAPFGVEIGRVTQHQGRSLIPFLRGEPSGSSAGALRLDGDLAGELVELGAVHGDVPPPKLAAQADDVVVALPDADAVGGGYRLGWLAGDRVEWFADVDQWDDQSPAFDVVLLPDRGLLAWDDWDRANHRSVVRVASFERDRPAPNPTLSIPVPNGTDAEQPRLLEGPSGAWLSWIALAKPAASASKPQPPELPSVIEPTHSWLELAALDDTGRPQGEPLRITPSDGHVVAYDGVPAHDGSVLFAVREADTLAELDEGSVWLIRVGADGSIHRERIETDGLGASAPSLVFDAAPGGGAPHGWLVLATGGGSTMLAGLTPWGSPLESPGPSSALGIGGVLAARQGALLVVTPHGRDAVFTMVRCRVQEAAMDASVPLTP